MANLSIPIVFTVLFVLVVVDVIWVQRIYAIENDVQRGKRHRVFIAINAILVVALFFVLYFKYGATAL